MAFHDETVFGSGSKILFKNMYAVSKAFFFIMISQSYTPAP